MDSLSPAARSRVMARVRSCGNRSTELVLRMALARAQVRGWTLHPHDVAGVPDFWFAAHRVAVFVDGCFWHGCAQCLRLPKNNREYWQHKIEGNVARARAVNRTLLVKQVRVVRVWEHDLRRAPARDAVLKRLLALLDER